MVPWAHVYVVSIMGGERWRVVPWAHECPTMRLVSVEEHVVYGRMECSMRGEYSVLGSWSVPCEWGVCVCVWGEGGGGGGGLGELMECPIMWGISARERVVYGLMECPTICQCDERGVIMWGDGEGSRG